MQDMPMQDTTKKGASKTQTRSDIGKQDDSGLGPNQLLGEHMDATGNPVADSTWGTKHKKPTDVLDDEADLYSAMNAETADFD
ncbi:uncharacterized protein N7511_006290 [Penicillium nucicola]|uniref:uncharacterized protein n=1 Tax=Penicillium nucicola TaxID=1850975 RepID=UPI002545036C|nr:uncharacterized protein N7511_006290 [Penicillium nucicola]KAJ5757596.1 hypothetical protein N7511_006290 [Penicillium nucicola]